MEESAGLPPRARHLTRGDDLCQETVGDQAIAEAIPLRAIDPAAFERANYMKVLQSWRPDPAGTLYRELLH